MKNAVHQYEDKLLEFAYGELPSHEADAVDAHVRGCARCAESLAHIRSVRTAMSQLPLEDAPDAGLESLLAYADQQAARNAAAQPKAWWKTMFFSGPRLATIGSIAALLTVGIVAWKANQIFDPDPGMLAVKQLAEKELAEAPPAPPPAKAENVAPEPTAVAPAAEGKLQEAGGGTQPVEKDEQKAELSNEQEPAKRDAYASGGDGEFDSASGTAPKAGAKELKKELKTSITRRAAPKAEDYSNVGTRSSVGAASPEVAQQARVTEKPSAPAKKSLPNYGLAGPVDTKGGANQNALADERRQRHEDAPAQVATATPAAPPPPEGQAAPRTSSLGLRSLGSGTSAGSTAAEEVPVEDVGDRLAADKDHAMRSRQAEVARKSNVEAARAAAQQGDRRAEIRYALEAIKAGAAGGDRLEMLKRLCDAHEALGEMTLADPFCDALLNEFPRSTAAGAVAQRRAYRQQMPTSTESEPKSGKAKKATADEAY